MYWKEPGETTNAFISVFSTFDSPPPSLRHDCTIPAGKHASTLFPSHALANFSEPRASVRGCAHRSRALAAQTYPFGHGSIRRIEWRGHGILRFQLRQNALKSRVEACSV